MTTPPSDPARPDEGTANPPPAADPAPTAEPPPAEATTATWSAPPAGSEPSQAERDPFAPQPTGALPPPTPAPTPPPHAAGAAPPSPPRSAGPADPQAAPGERGLVHRTLPLAIAAVLGGAVAGGIVALSNATSNDARVVVTAPSSPPTAEAAPAPSTQPPAATQPGGEQPQSQQGQGTQGGNDQGATPAEPAAGDAWLGVEVSPVDQTLADRVQLATDHGVMIADVVPDSPADQAGFRHADGSIEIDGRQYAFGGDIVTAIDGEQVRSIDDLRRIVGQHQAGDTVHVLVTRADGTQATLDVTLAARPADGTAPQNG